MPNTSTIFQRTSLIPSGVTDEQITRWSPKADLPYRGLGHLIAEDMVLHDLRETPYITGVDQIDASTLAMLVDDYFFKSSALRYAGTTENVAPENLRDALTEIVEKAENEMIYGNRFEHRTFLHCTATIVIDGLPMLVSDLPMIDVSKPIVKLPTAEDGIRYYAYDVNEELFTEVCNDCNESYTCRIVSIRTNQDTRLSEYRLQRHSLQDECGDAVICYYCHEDNYGECDDCGDYVNHERHSCSSRNRDFTCNASSDHSVGDTTLQFGQRTIGIEFETGSGARNYDFHSKFASKFPKWGVHEDGSLGDDALEFVTNPIGGHYIQNQVLEFYKLCNDWGVETQDKSAGMHIHIGCADIYELIGGHQNKTWTDGSANDLVERHIIAGSLESRGSDCPYEKTASDDVKLINHADVPEEAMIMMGNAFVNIARCFINKSRSVNNYCRSPFGFRDKGSKSAVLKKTTDYTYPAIALRNLKTMEFRLYPSTTSVNYALARIELSQKLVEFMALNMVKYQDAYAQGITETAMPDVFKMLRLSSAINHADEVYPINVVDKLGDMIGLSTEARTHLQFLYTRSHLNSASSTFQL